MASLRVNSVKKNFRHPQKLNSRLVLRSFNKLDDFIDDNVNNSALDIKTIKNQFQLVFTLLIFLILNELV